MALKPADVKWGGVKSATFSHKFTNAASGVSQHYNFDISSLNASEILSVMIINDQAAVFLGGIESYSATRIDTFFRNYYTTAIDANIAIKVVYK